MGNQKRKSRKKRGGEETGGIDWKTKLPMKVCLQQVNDRKTKCKAKCVKPGMSPKKIKGCKKKHKDMCILGESCESQKTKDDAEALVKGIHACDLKGVKMYNACQAVCPDKSANFGQRMDPDTDCYPKHPECNFKKMQNWTRQAREVSCKKWEPGGGEYEKKQMNAKDDCAAKSTPVKKYIKDEKLLYYAKAGRCQLETIKNDFCKGKVKKSGAFTKKYGVICEVDPDIAYKKSPKECLKCGGRRSKHKRTKKKRRRKNKTRKSRKRKRTKRRRKHNKK
jgi:hypothetical protein